MTSAKEMGQLVNKKEVVMTFEEWWKDNKIYWIGSSRPAVEAAWAAWNAGYSAAIDSVASGE